MVILSNCLTEKVDEGCLKVANSLTKRIKKKCPSTTLLTYERISAESDRHLELNKLFLNRELFSILRKKKEPVLYIPFSSNTKASILRTFILSLFSKAQVNVLFVLLHPVDGIFRKLLRWSRARIVTLSGESCDFFRMLMGTEPIRLKIGVDVQQFTPVDAQQKAELREKYGIAKNAKVLLHVGHLKEGRNIRTLLNVDEAFHVVLVVSTQSESQWDAQLRAKLVSRPNTTIIDTFVEKIEQIYQMADVYIFPVQEAGNCIDIPLSVLEASACGIPVVATDYGELKELIGKEGFYQILSFERVPLNELLYKAYAEKKSGRVSVMEYDWDRTVDYLLSMDAAKE